MIKKLGKVIVGVLAGTMLIPNIASAAESNDYVEFVIPEIICEETYDTVSGIDDLYEDYISGSLMVESSEESNDSLEFTTVQVISETELSDGSLVTELQKDYVTLIDSKASVDNAKKKKSWGKYDIACVVTAFYEEHYGKGSEVGVTLKSTQFKFTDNGSNPVYVKKVQMYSHCLYDPARGDQVERYATYNNPSSGTIYSLASGDSRIYGGGGFQGINCGAIVTLSDGTVTGDYDLMVILV